MTYKNKSRASAVFLSRLVNAMVFTLFLMVSDAFAETYCVVDELLPITESPGGSYVLEEHGVYGKEVLGIVVYGNHVTAAPVTGKFGASWVDLQDPDGNGSLGFIELKGLKPRPELDVFDEKQYLVKRDEPKLLLYPENDERYNLSKFGFSLGKGEVVTACGKSGEWLLLGFSTSVEESGEGGVGMRYAWASADDFTLLDGYEPDNSKADPAWTPSGIRNLKFEPISGDAAAFISRQGFRISPEPIIQSYIQADDMADLYSGTGEYSVDFITADLFLHSWHILFDGLLKDLEESFFAPTLDECLKDALAELDNAERDRRNGAVPAEALAKARDMFQLTLALLRGNSDESLSARAKEEFRRIEKSDAVTVSEITGALSDYTQYRPRGHYTASPALERYFRSMSFLGGAGITLFDKNGIPDNENIRTAALITLVLGPKWKNFEQPLDFIMGDSDDAGPDTLRELVLKDIGEVDNIGDSEKIGRLAEDMRGTLVQPKIKDTPEGNVSNDVKRATQTREFRICGKRFTFDAYIFNQLTSPSVGTDTKPRNLPETADVMAVLGSPAADSVAVRSDGFKYYRENLDRLKNEITEYLSRGETIYALWLETLKNVLADSGSKQFFYRSPGWQWKKLLTASSSWAELKHDTILYAKQSGAEMGAGGWYAGKFAPPLPRGYVEPDPQAFAAMIAETERLSGIFGKFSFGDQANDDSYLKKMAVFRDLCESAKNIASKEVSQAPLSNEDYATVKRLARSFDISLLLPPGMYGIEDWEQLRMAIIADVATDFLDGRVLYAATGTPREITVFVNDRSGGPRLARGYVYSYYEFAGSLSDGRMNDDEWRGMVYDEERQADLIKLRPGWYSRFE